MTRLAGILTAISILNAPRFASSMTFNVRKKHFAAVERVPHDVERPNGIQPRFDHHRLALSFRHTSLRPARQVQAQLAVHSPDPFVVPAVAQCPQSIVAFPESPARVFSDDRLERFNELDVSRHLIHARLVKRRPRQPGCLAGASDRDAVLLGHDPDGLAPG